MGNSSRDDDTEAAPVTLELIVTEHLAFIRACLTGYGVRSADLDDLAQEVLAGAHRSLSRYHGGHAGLRAWLRGIAKRQASNHRRRAHQRYEQLHPAEELDAFHDAAGDIEQRVSDKRQLGRLIEEVPPERRGVLVAFELCGVAMGQITTALSIPLKTGWSRLRSAHEDLAAAARREQARRRWRRLAFAPEASGLRAEGDPVPGGVDEAFSTFLQRFRELARKAIAGAAPPGNRPPAAPAFGRPGVLGAAHALAGVALAGAVLLHGDLRAAPEPGPRAGKLAPTVATTARTAAFPPALPHLPSVVASEAAATASQATAPAFPLPAAMMLARRTAATEAARRADERALVGHATAALGAGDLEEAAAALARHEREFPIGQYAPEREALRARLRALRAGGARRAAPP